MNKKNGEEKPKKNEKMWQHHAFPSAQAIKSADAHQTAELPKGTTNLQLRTSPQYTLRPYRFSVTTNVASFTENGTTKPFHNFSAHFINIPDVYFPPDGAMCVELESVRSRYAYNGYVYTNKAGYTSHTLPSEGFVVHTENLAQPAFTEGGVGHRMETFYSGPGSFYDALESPASIQNALGVTTAQGMAVNCSRRITAKHVAPVFAHNGLQFSFNMAVYNIDAPASTDYWVSTTLYDPTKNPSRVDPLEVTFVVYPNPYWSQRF